MADDRKEGRSVARRAEEDEEAATSIPESATNRSISERRVGGGVTHYESRETRSAGSSKSTELGAGAYSEMLVASVHSARAHPRLATCHATRAVTHHSPREHLRRCSPGLFLSSDLYPSMILAV